MDVRKNKKYKDTVSLDEPLLHIDENEKISLMDIIPGDLNIEDDLIEKEKKELLYKAISTLKPEERELLKHYYNDINKMSQRDIANKLNVRQPTINRRLQRIIKKIQKNIKYDKE